MTLQKWIKDGVIWGFVIIKNLQVSHIEDTKNCRLDKVFRDLYH